MEIPASSSTLFEDKGRDISRAGAIYQAEAAAAPILMDCMQKTWLAVSACIE